MPFKIDQIENATPKRRQVVKKNADIEDQESPMDCGATSRDQNSEAISRLKMNKHGTSCTVGKMAESQMG